MKMHCIIITIFKKRTALINPETPSLQAYSMYSCENDDTTGRPLRHTVWRMTTFTYGIVTVEFSNSQVMLRGCETPGYVIVSAAAASIVSCHHKPMWQQQQLKSKTSWVGSVECMQVGSKCLSIYCFYCMYFRCILEGVLCQHGFMCGCMQ